MHRELTTSLCNFEQCFALRNLLFSNLLPKDSCFFPNPLIRNLCFWKCLLEFFLFFCNSTYWNFVFLKVLAWGHLFFLNSVYWYFVFLKAGLLCFQGFCFSACNLCNIFYFMYCFSVAQCLAFLRVLLFLPFAFASRVIGIFCFWKGLLKDLSLKCNSVYWNYVIWKVLAWGICSFFKLLCLSTHNLRNFLLYFMIFYF